MNQIWPAPTSREVFTPSLFQIMSALRVQQGKLTIVTDGADIGLISELAKNPDLHKLANSFCRSLAVNICKDRTLVDKNSLLIIQGEQVETSHQLKESNHD